MAVRVEAQSDDGRDMSDTWSDNDQEDQNNKIIMRVTQLVIQGMIIMIWENLLLSFRYCIN